MRLTLPSSKMVLKWGGWRWVTCLFLPLNIRNSGEKFHLPTPVAHSRFSVQEKQDYCMDETLNLKEHPRIEKFSRALSGLGSLLSLLLTEKFLLGSLVPLVKSPQPPTTTTKRNESSSTSLSWTIEPAYAVTALGSQTYSWAIRCREVEWEGGSSYIRLRAVGKPWISLKNVERKWDNGLKWTRWPVSLRDEISCLGVSVTSLTVWMWKPGLREVKGLAQGHPKLSCGWTRTRTWTLLPPSLVLGFP